MAGTDLITTLVPHLSAVVIGHVAARGATVHVWARTRSRPVDCPGCGTPSARVHSRYQRTLSDAPVCGRPLVVHLKVRRLRCCHADCPRATFVEQVQGLTVAHARRSRVLRQALQRDQVPGGQFRQPVTKASGHEAVPDVVFERPPALPPCA